MGGSGRGSWSWPEELGKSGQTGRVDSRKLEDRSPGFKAGSRNATFRTHSKSVLRHWPVFLWIRNSSKILTSQDIRNKIFQVWDIYYRGIWLMVCDAAFGTGAYLRGWIQDVEKRRYSERRLIWHWLTRVIKTQNRAQQKLLSHSMA
jgi:hypothetical protein